MRKDPTEFRERFQRWKEGEQVYEAGLPKYADGLTPYNKRDVNTNQALYNSEEDLYSPRYTLPEVTVTGNKNKVGTGMGERLYMHPWKTVGDLIAEENATRPSVEERAARAPYEKDLHKPLSPVDPVGELIVGNTVGGPVFNYVGNVAKPVLKQSLNIANRAFDKISPLVYKIPENKVANFMSKRAFGDPTISEQQYMSLMKDWLEDQTTFMTPFRKGASTGQTVGDVIDYNWGLYGGKDKLISELSENKRWSLLKAMENSEERPRMMKAIHMDETGLQPVNERGFVPKDNTNSNSTWYSGGKPEIWWNRGKMYYSPKQYRDAFQIPTTYVADINTLRNYGIKFPTDQINVLHAPGVVPYESIDFALRPNGLTGFFDKIKYQSQ